jgi:endonuclease/exonuclease/phosphatase family metal-dependent hydrolase
MLGHRLIAGGDYNAKHTDWGSRLITRRGHKVLKTIERNNVRRLSKGEPTYWPSDRNKLSDLVDFCVTKGISKNFAVTESCFDLSSDHSPVFITLRAHALYEENKPSSNNRHTN